VFIDAGSNRGVHGRFLFEPDKYPNSKFVEKFAQIFGGNRTLQNICVFAFEPNVELHNRSQRATEQAYQKMGWRYHYLPFAVSDHDGEAIFFRNQDYLSGKNNEEWGFGSVFHETSNSTDYKKSQEASVQLIDLSRWIRENVLLRTIPPPNEYNGNRKPMIAMKMDIEGSEYSILTHLFETNVFCQLDHVLGEFHLAEAPQVVGLWNATQRIGDLYLNTRKEIRAYRRKLMLRLATCGAGFEQFDEEEYLHDGLPYPETK
jgi:FkbM family methyltransferase